MERYKFTTKAYGQNGDFGVDHTSLDKSETALNEIGWHGWTSNEIQNIINKSNSLQADKNFYYQVNGSDFYIIVKKEIVNMYSRNSLFLI